MSRPDKPGELRDVTVSAISLVSKAANGEKFKIFKSVEDEAPESVERNERGLFHILKRFFTGSDETVEKGEVANIYNQNEAGRKMDKAFSALLKVLGLSRWDDENLMPETDTAKIIAALDDFRNIAVEILLGKTELEKSGRKISGSRLSKLKSIQAMLQEVLNDIDDKEETSQEAEELTKEEILKAVDEALKPVSERIEKINIDETINKALAPVIERIEKIENARGVSNRVQEEGNIEKSDSNFWGGVF